MKQIFFSLSIAAALLSSSFTYAADGKPGEQVVKAFHKEFSTAQNAEWIDTKKEGVCQVKFTYNNETLQAYFTDEGEFLGTLRQVTKTQLPILTIKALDKEYADSHIATVFEYGREDGVSYYITLITPKGSMIVKATGNGNLTVHQRKAE